ncbi:YHS domain protein [Flavobacteriaceae bacterium]|nr:YHS domain protein [Flavobacteriaceae bacterium]MDC1460300.1 YHS domain protein [Flavobacteriaceae bacterium]
MKNTAILLFLLMSSITYAQDKSVSDFNLPKSRVAVQGYDVVFYFNASPKEGSKSIQSTDLGVHYYFSSQKKKSLFDKNPNRYIPKYGGWFAYTMSRGDEVGINSEAYLIQKDS